MAMNTQVLLKAQLSRVYLDGLRERYGADIGLQNVNEIQSAAPLTMLGRLRKIKPDLLLLAVEDENSRCVLPVMELLGLLTSARQVAVVGEDFREVRLSRWSILRALVSLGTATVVAAWHTVLATVETGVLVRAGRNPVASADIRRLLYVNANLWFGVKAGGSVGHISGVVNALLDRGIAVDFASCGTRLMVRESAGYIPLPAPRAFGIPFEINYYRFSRFVTRFLCSMHHHPRYDAIYQRLSLGNYSGAVLARRLKIPLITEYNGSEAWVARNWGRPLRLHSLAVRAEDAMLRHSDVVVTVSDVLAAELLQRGVPQERIVSYPNCIDPQMFDPARYSPESIHALRARLGIPDDAVVATFVGTFGQWHGADVLAAAIADLVAGHSAWLREHQVTFVLVGDGIKMPVVRQILERVDSGPFVRLVGLVPQGEAPGYLAASDILLSPHVENADGTSFFGSPTKLFEYMAMGKAIVASRLDQIGEVLAGGLDASSPPTDDRAEASDAVAVLCKPGDVGELQAGIRFCVANTDWRLRLGVNARQRALQRYTWKHHVQAILDGLARISNN